MEALFSGSHGPFDTLSAKWTAPMDDERLRLRDRRRRLGRLRARQSAVGARRICGCCCSRPAEPTPIPSSTCRRASPAGRQSRRQLALLHRARAAAAREAGCTGRAAGCSAAAVRSTPCATRAAIALDYDEWAALAGPGWSYARVLPYFLKAEDQARGAERVSWHRRPAVGRGSEVPQSVERGVRRGGRGLRTAAQSRLQRRLSRRASASTRSRSARPPLQRGRVPICGRRDRGANLEIRRTASRTRVVFSGTRAIGVEYRAGRRVVRVRVPSARCCWPPAPSARRSCCCCRGSDPPMSCAQLGIAVVADLPEVGCNLQDHLDFCTLNKCTQPITLRFQRVAGVGRRAALSADALRARRQQHRRGGRLRAHGAGARSAARRAAAFRAGAARRSWPQSAAGPRLHDPCLRAAAPQPRTTAAALQPARGPAAHPCPLSERCAAISTCCSKASAVARRSSWPRRSAPFRGAEIFPGSGAHHATAARGRSSGARRRRSITRPAPAAWAATPHSVVDPQLRVRGVEGAARGRRLGHAAADRRQHQRADHHDCREGGRLRARRRPLSAPARATSIHGTAGRRRAQPGRAPVLIICTRTTRR